MAEYIERYTKVDDEGRYYIESANGKLESNIKGHTYGNAIDRLAEFENTDVVPRAEYDKLFDECGNQGVWWRQHFESIYETAKQEFAREIFEEIERETKNHGITYTQRKIAELKKKYTENKGE